MNRRAGRARGGRPLPIASMAAGDDMGVAPQDPARNDPTMMRSHDGDTVNA